MGLLSDREIISLQKKHNVISDFRGELVRSVRGKRVVSFGLGSTGYDLRLGTRFWMPNYPQGVADPHDSMGDIAEIFCYDECLLLPGTYILAQTFERINMPPDVTGLVFGKSTYARLGVVANVTPFEPGWSGVPTISLANTGQHPVRLAIGEGIVQILFFAANELPLVSYADRNGKYQNQVGVTPAKV